MNIKSIIEVIVLLIIVTAMVKLLSIEGVLIGFLAYYIWSERK